ncbi:MAG TPA: aldo/keto reductase, partial [Candidatus Elarobacter sp.]
AGELRRAAEVAPIAALQSEYSLVTRDIETDGVLEAARALGVALVAYAPLGRGLLSGAVRSTASFTEDDLRRRVPRFDAGNFERNLRLVDTFANIAAEFGTTPARLAIAWVLAQGDDVVALPGAQSVAQIEENAAAADLSLDAATLARLDAIFPAGAARGERIR